MFSEKAEENCARELKQAQINEDYVALAQKFCLMGEIYIDRSKRPALNQSLIERQYLLIKAAVLYNCANNVIIEKLPSYTPEQDIPTVKTKLIELEADFISFLGKTENPFPFAKVNFEHKNKLKIIREETKKALAKINWQEGQSVEKLYENITKSMKLFILKLWDECIETIDPEPPCKYALISFGSMARGEITPYSDFEWGILLENSCELNKEYFKKLTSLLYLKVVNLGETILPAIDIESLKGVDDFITKRGFTFDGQMSRACKTPFGKKYKHSNDFDLLGTPDELAELQNKEWDKKDPLLSSEIYQFTLIAGNEELARAYQCKMRDILDNSIACTTFQTPYPPIVLRKVRSLRLLEGVLLEFNLDLLQSGGDGKLYQVKKDLYRLPTAILDILGLYYSLQENITGIKSSWEKIDILAKQGFFSKESSIFLKEVLNFITALRLHTYIHNDGQREYMAASILTIHDRDYSIMQEENTTKRVFHLPNLGGLFKAYQILISLQDGIKKFVSSEGSIGAIQIVLRDDNYTKGLIYNRFMQYSLAKSCLEKALQEAPENINVSIALGELLCIIGKPREGIGYLEKVFEPTSAIPLEKKINYLITMGDAWYNLQKYDEAMKNYNKADALTFSTGTSHIKSFLLRIRRTILYNKAKVYHALSQYDKAIAYYQQAIAVLKTEQSEQEMAFIFCGLGDTYKWKNILEKAEKSFKQALYINVELYGNQHPNTADVLWQLGDLYRHFAKFEHAVEYGEMALKCYKKVYVDKQHSKLSAALGVIGLAYSMLHKYELALDALEQALKIDESKNGDNLISLAKSLNNLGQVCIELEKYDEAIKYYNRSLQFFEKSLPSVTKKIVGYTTGHLEVAIALTNLGEAYFLDDPNSLQARNFFRKSLLIHLNLDNKGEHFQVARNFRFLGKAGNNMPALLHCIKAVSILTNLKYPVTHSSVINAKKELSFVLFKILYLEHKSILCMYTLLLLENLCTITRVYHGRWHNMLTIYTKPLKLFMKITDFYLLCFKFKLDQHKFSQAIMFFKDYINLLTNVIALINEDNFVETLSIKLDRQLKTFHEPSCLPGKPITYMADNALYPHDEKTYERSKCTSRNKLIYR